MNVTMLEVLELLEIGAPARVPGHIHCTLHDEATASLCVYDDGWWCYGCGKGGSPIDFIMATFGCSFGKALCYVRSGIVDVDDRPERAPRPEPEPVDFGDRLHAEYALATAKGVAEASNFVAEKWPHLNYGRLRLWDSIVPGAHFLMIPHRDADGVIRGVKTRTTWGGNKGAKRSFAGSTYPRLYRILDNPTADVAWLVEGESDTWTAEAHVERLQLDRAVFGLPTGASCWKPAYRDELLRYETVMVMLDNDIAGEEASGRILHDLEKAGHTRVYRVRPPAGFNDWSDAAVAGAW